MQCLARDEQQLSMSSRQDSPKCRGLMLERGELEKIIERGQRKVKLASALASTAAAAVGVAWRRAHGRSRAHEVAAGLATRSASLPSGCSIEAGPNVRAVRTPMIAVNRFAPARTVGLFAVAALVLCAAAAPLLAFADERTVFRSRMPDGRVVYADAPASGAARSARLLVEPHPGDAAQALAAQQALEASRESLRREARARALRVEQLDKGAALAAREFESALSAQAQGEAIGEGDRQGRRITPTYWQRQQRLDEAVVRARARLNDLTAERAAVR